MRKLLLLVILALPALVATLGAVLAQSRNGP